MDYTEMKQKAREIKIVDYLTSLGIQPVRSRGTTYLYSAPYREDKTPSMLVDTERNIFTDLGGSNDKGDIITLAQLIGGTDFKSALETLLKHDSFSFIEPNTVSTQGLEILKVKPLENKALLQYLDTRNIPETIAQAHLQEVYFTLNGKCRNGNKPYFALHFPNEAGGAELRSKQFKGGTAPKSYSFVRGRSSHQVNIYEGFTDFLSGLSSKGSPEPAYDSIILNSVSMFRKAAPAIRRYARVNCFLDNDEAGNNAFSQISQLVEAVDYRDFYAGFKDLGEWWEGRGGG